MAEVLIAGLAGAVGGFIGAFIVTVFRSRR